MYTVEKCIFVTILQSSAKGENNGDEIQSIDPEC